MQRPFHNPTADYIIRLLATIFPLVAQIPDGMLYPKNDPIIELDDYQPSPVKKNFVVLNYSPDAFHFDSSLNALKLYKSVVPTCERLGYCKLKSGRKAMEKRHKHFAVSMAVLQK